MLFAGIGITPSITGQISFRPQTVNMSLAECAIVQNLDGSVKNSFFKKPHNPISIIDELGVIFTFILMYYIFTQNR